jgi:SAM-dependent methyltransferase
MRFDRLRSHWERYGASDPMEAVLTTSGAGDATWNPEAFFRLGRADVERALRLAGSCSVPVARGRALDFGCGVGRLAQALADSFDEVVGVDIAASMISAAESYNTRPGKLRFVQNAAPDLGIFRDGEFDFVLCHIVLQHLEPVLARKYVAEFIRVLRPGGVAVFQVPTSRTGRRLQYALIRRVPGLVRLYRRMRYGITPNREMHVLPKPDVVRVVSRAGGEVLAVEDDGDSVPDFVSSIFVAVRR